MSTDMESGESISSEQEEDKNIIDKILGEMKSQFNKTEKKDETEKKEETEQNESSLATAETITEPEKTETAETNQIESESPETTSDEVNDKPRLVLLFKKPTSEAKQKVDLSPNRRSPRNKSNYDEEIVVKRSTRRRSKDYTESVLQNAIARKEKSYNESNKPQRLTRQLKPTQKILENLAIAKQSRKKVSDPDSDNASEKPHKKTKHHHSRHVKKKWRDSSESDQSNEENPPCRRSRKTSTSNSKEGLMDVDGDVDDSSYKCSSSEHIVSQLCLCNQSTQYYLAKIDEEITYCSAVDSIGDKFIGCSRVVESKEIMMLRPSTRVPYLVLCESHKNRLLRHNCCPTCGIFCTQGRFVECQSRHYYHRDCQISVGNTECCPHCGSSTSQFDVNLTMHTEKRPVFLPVQKSQHNPARMTFGGKNVEGVKCVTPPLIPPDTLELLNSDPCTDEEYEMIDLVTAIKNNALDKVAQILSSKSVDLTTKLPDFNEGTVLHLAAHYGFNAIVHMLLVSGLQPDTFDKDQNTPLMLSVLAEKTDVVEYLIKIGASVDLKGTDGMTSLHLAAKCGNIQSCELVLRAAAGIKSFVNIPDDGGWSPLVWACEHGYSNIANFLMHKGADPSMRDVEHNVALHWASFSGSSHIVELLLGKGCDVNAANAHGDTPLHIGARQDMYNCVLVLLARGADVTLLNKNNETPLDCVPPGGDCYNPISLNLTLQASAEYDCPNVVLSNDISRGKEINPIQCYNNVDNVPNPTDYKYIAKSCTTSDDVRIDKKINTMQSCACQERCVEEDCACGKLSLRCWYDEEGKLIPEFNFNDIPMIFECNDGCSCNAITCNNRVVQKGLTQRFELFRTVDKGWAIRTLRLIPKGNFVCEYVGEIITDAEADKREDDSYMFDLENRVSKSIDDDSYCIDSKFYGNFARFINHSCDPSLTPVKVFMDHQDLRFPRVVFFANRDIFSNEELSFNYGDKFWMAKYKSLSCFCGSVECKYSEETIEGTLQNYQRSLEESG